MHHHQVHVGVFHAVVGAVLPGAGLLVQHVEPAHPGQLRQAGVAGQGLVFVGAGAVHDEDGLLVGRQVVGQPHPQVGDVVAVLHAAGLLQHLFSDAVDPAVDGLGVAAPADKGVQLLQPDAVAVHKIQNGRLAVVVLVPVAGKGLDLRRRMGQRLGVHAPVVLEIGDLGGGGAEIDDNELLHGIPPGLF